MWVWKQVLNILVIGIGLRDRYFINTAARKSHVQNHEYNFASLHAPVISVNIHSFTRLKKDYSLAIIYPPPTVPTSMLVNPRKLSLTKFKKAKSGFEKYLYHDKKLSSQ